MTFFIGVDLGQSNDPTAIAVVQRVGEEFRCGHLERVPLGTPYPAIVTRVGAMMQHPTVAGDCELAIDATGVGRPVADMFTHAGIRFTGVIITAGHEESTSGADNYRNVPKVTLVSHLQSLLHEGRLKIQRGLPEADALVRELQDFRVGFSATGFMSFNAREGKHDDLVLALAIAVWCAKRQKTGQESWGDFLINWSKSHTSDDPHEEPRFGWSVTDPATLVAVAFPEGPISDEGRVMVGGNTFVASYHSEGKKFADIPRQHLRELMSRPAWAAANPELAVELGIVEPAP